MAFVHGGMPSTKSEQKEDDRPKTNNRQRFSKSSSFNMSWNANETKQMEINNCPLADGTNKLWNCPIFKNMNVNDLYAAVRKERSCSGEKACKKDCKVHPDCTDIVSIIRCTKKHNRMLQSENQLGEGIHPLHVSAAAVNQINEENSFLQIVSVSVQSGGNRSTT